ncbi:hypothetical protein N0V84_007832 [Fusarium piperis]|uniref:non-specific serine/threonine protein kinase n=1 Tax=Fusarium piperis TaxID=1435070 RepID=A0A9W8W983_9HYPO|nr:hypothetical protein N0V84_007832 [Fusarium piperis]
MPNTEASTSQSQKHPLSAEQEQQIVDWASKERFSGTVVRNDLISWFAERLAQRDGVEEGLGSDFAHDFLTRHPDLAKKLVVPPHPSHERPQAVTTTGRRSGLERLREMREKDRVEALFGDSPPPQRQPAPYPEGEIIYRCNNRYIVRHGDSVTKYTTFPDGLGPRDHPNEAQVLRFVKEHTTIPVPEVISSDWDRITMEYIEGKTLQQAWPVLTPDQRSNILAELSGYIAQMRALGGIYIGRLDGQGAIVPSILTRSGGPFGTLTEFHDWLVHPPKRLRAQSMYWHQITTQLGVEHPIVFTHGDIAARNILVRDGHIVALLDWEFAGWYPEYWEYVFAIRGMDKLDWESLGNRVPSLFAKRHDLEYILVGSIKQLVHKFPLNPIVPLLRLQPVGHNRLQTFKYKVLAVPPVIFLMAFHRNRRCYIRWQHLLTSSYPDSPGVNMVKVAETQRPIDPLMHSVNIPRVTFFIPLCMDSLV